MDISRDEQRVLHHMAQGGYIAVVKDGKTIIELHCMTRDGWEVPDLSLELFRKLKRRRTIASCSGQPYRITKRGLQLVRSQLNNR